MRTIENRTEDMVPNALNAVLGVALVLMPWYLNLGSETAAARNAFVCGMAIAIIAALALSKSYDWEEYINLAVGLWVSIAPWMLGFADSPVPTWSHVVIGLAVAALAAFELWRLFVSPQARSI